MAALQAASNKRQCDELTESPEKNQKEGQEDQLPMLPVGFIGSIVPLYSLQRDYRGLF